MKKKREHGIKKQLQIGFFWVQDQISVYCKEKFIYSTRFLFGAGDTAA